MNKSLIHLIRPHYQTLKGYISARMEVKKASDLTFMNANENPYELPGLEGFNRYPQPQPEPLLKAYASAYDVNPDQIVATRGADEAISLLTKLFCQPGKDAILTCPPTFGMYKVSADAVPTNVIEVPLLKTKDTFALDMQGIKKNIEHIKLVFLCSPNNPTGTSLSREDIGSLCKAAEGKAAVILDETYAEFSKIGSMTGMLNELPNLIILRTLSKAYSMAGMRMGCMITNDTDFISLVRTKALDAYPLTLASIDAALSALKNKEQAQENIQKLLTERERIIPLLREKNCIKHIFPSDANYLLIEFKDAKAFYDFAAQNKLILRDFSTAPGTENCLRISIGTPEQNNLLLSLMKRFSKESSDRAT